MSKNLIKLKSESLKLEMHTLNVADVMIMNHQTYRNPIVKHQYVKNLSNLKLSIFNLSTLSFGGGYRSRTDDPLRARQVL